MKKGEEALSEYKWTSKMPAPFDEQSALPDDSISQSDAKINHFEKSFYRVK